MLDIVTHSLSWSFLTVILFQDTEIDFVSAFCIFLRCLDLFLAEEEDLPITALEKVLFSTLSVIPEVKAYDGL